MPTLRGILAPAGLATVLFLARTPHAQAQTASGATTFSDARGLMWGVGVLETSIAVGAAIIAGGDTCESWGCGVLLLLFSSAGLAAGIVTGIATQIGGAPPDVPFTVHEALWGGLGGLALGEGIAKAARASPRAEVALAVGGALLFGGGAAGYAIGRRDVLHRDPETTVATHMLAWAPIAVAAFSMYVFRDIEAPSGLLALAVAILATQALSVLAVELNASGAPAGTVAPLFSYSAPL